MGAVLKFVNNWYSSAHNKNNKIMPRLKKANAKKGTTDDEVKTAAKVVNSERQRSEKVRRGSKPVTGKGWFAYKRCASQRCGGQGMQRGVSI